MRKEAITLEEGVGAWEVRGKTEGANGERAAGGLRARAHTALN